jgi:hypothetical protein
VKEPKQHSRRHGTRGGAHDGQQPECRYGVGPNGKETTNAQNLHASLRAAGIALGIALAPQFPIAGLLGVIANLPRPAA